MVWPFSSGFQAGRGDPTVVEGASSPGTAYTVPKEEKETKVDVNTAQPNTVAKTVASRVNESIIYAETNSSDVPTPADYYRRGRLKSAQGSEYDYHPRFIQDPEEEDVASLRLVGKSSDKSKKTDIDLIPPYSKFFLESYQEGHTERSQIVETFGEAYAFFFGERPPIYTFGGTLLNTKDINWKEDFMFYYDNFLRGTKAVELKARVILTYNLSQIEGYIMGVSTQAQAANDKGVGLSFQMLVTKRRTMSLSVDFGISEYNGSFNPDPAISKQLALGKSDPEVSAAYNTAIKVNAGLFPPAQAKALTQAEIDQTNKAIANEMEFIKSQKQMTYDQGKVRLT